MRWLASFIVAFDRTMRTPFGLQAEDRDFAPKSAPTFLKGRHFSYCFPVHDRRDFGNDLRSATHPLAAGAVGKRCCIGDFLDLR